MLACTFFIWLMKFPVDLMDPEIALLHKLQIALTFSPFNFETKKYFPSSSFGRRWKSVSSAGNGFVVVVLFGDDVVGAAAGMFYIIFDSASWQS